MVVYLHDTFDYSLVLAEEKYRQTRRLERGEKKRALAKYVSLSFTLKTKPICQKGTNNFSIKSLQGPRVNLKTIDIGNSTHYKKYT